MAPSRIVFGLGNPGPGYAATRHNLGFRVVEALAARAGHKWRPLPGLQADSAGVALGACDVLLVRPLTYVNRCGGVADALLARLAVGPEALLVVVDDYHLPLGTLRLRGQGSDGGHNGLRSILEALGTRDFPRLRVGIGGPGEQAPEEFVLAEFASSERPAVEAAVGRAADAVGLWAGLDLATAMQRVNAPDLDRDPERA